MKVLTISELINILQEAQEISGPDTIVSLWNDPGDNILLCPLDRGSSVKNKLHTEKDKTFLHLECFEPDADNENNDWVDKINLKQA
jgi:hypothetical protein